MNYVQKIIIVLIISTAFWFQMRWFIWGLKSYYYNKSALKKLKKDQTIKEWFFYSKYKKIPKSIITIYLILSILHLVFIISFIFFCIFKIFVESLNNILLGLIMFDFSIDIIFLLLFWTADGSIPYERWFKK